MSFWRCHSMICGRCSRTFFTSTWDTGQTLFDQRLEVGPFAGAGGEEVFHGQVEAAISSVATTSMSCSAAP